MKPILLCSGALSKHILCHPGTRSAIEWLIVQRDVQAIYRRLDLIDKQCGEWVDSLVVCLKRIFLIGRGEWYDHTAGRKLYIRK